MLETPNIITLALCIVTILLSFTYQHLLFYKKIDAGSKTSKIIFGIFVTFCILSILSIIIFALLPKTQM